MNYLCLCLYYNIFNYLQLFFMISHDESMSPDYIDFAWHASQFFDDHWVILFLLRSLQLAVLIHSCISKLPPLENGPGSPFQWDSLEVNHSRQRCGAVGFIIWNALPSRKSLWKEPRIWRVIGDRLVVNEDRLWMLEQAIVGSWEVKGVVPMWKVLIPGVWSRRIFWGCFWDIQGAHLT